MFSLKDKKTKEKDDEQHLDIKKSKDKDEECLIKVQRLENEKGHYEILLKRANIILELESSAEMIVSKVTGTHWLVVKPIMPLSLFLYTKSADGWDRKIVYITEFPLKQAVKKNPEVKEEPNTEASQSSKEVVNEEKYAN